MWKNRGKNTSNIWHVLCFFLVEKKFGQTGTIRMFIMDFKLDYLLDGIRIGEKWIEICFRVLDIEWGRKDRWLNGIFLRRTLHNKWGYWTSKSFTMPYTRKTIACNGILRLKYVIIKQQKKTNQCKHLAQKFMYKLLWYSREMTRFNSNFMLTHLMESSCFSSARSIHSSVSNGVSQLKFRQFLFVRRRQKVN